MGNFPCKINHVHGCTKTSENGYYLLGEKVRKNVQWIGHFNVNSLQFFFVYEIKTKSESNHDSHKNISVLNILQYNREN